MLLILPASAAASITSLSLPLMRTTWALRTHRQRLRSTSTPSTPGMFRSSRRMSVSHRRRGVTSVGLEVWLTVWPAKVRYSDRSSRKAVSSSRIRMRRSLPRPGGTLAGAPACGIEYTSRWPPSFWPGWQNANLWAHISLRLSSFKPATVPEFTSNRNEFALTEGRRGRGVRRKTGIPSFNTG